MTGGIQLRPDKGKKRKKKSRNCYSSEVLFILDTLLLIGFGLILLRYLPPRIFLNFEIVLGNQDFRFLFIFFHIILLLCNLRAGRHLPSFVGLAAIAILVAEFFAYIPLKGNKAIYPEDQRVRVLTLNCATRSPFEVISYLEQEKPDVVCLQEVHLYSQDDLIRMADSVGYQGHYQHLRRDSGMGVVLLTRGTITRIDSLSAESFHWNWRVFMNVTLNLKGEDVHLIGVQLESIDRKRDWAGAMESWRYRLRQSRAVAAALDRAEGRFIVLGDYNATPTDRSISPIRKRLKDAWLEAGKGLGATWSNKHPVFRIDQVCYRGFKGASNPHIFPLTESDHLAYQVDLLIK